MQGHDNPALLRHGNDPLQEVFDIFPQAFFAKFSVGFDQAPNLFLGVG